MITSRGTNVPTESTFEAQRTGEPASPEAASRWIADLAQVITQGHGVSGQDVPDVQGLVVEKAVEALSASAGSVMMPDYRPGSMRVVAAIGLPAADADDPPESLVAEWVVQNDQPVLLLGRTGPLAHLLHREDIRDAVCVPLRYAGRPIGALSVSNSRDREPFGASDVEILTALGHLAAVALQNTRLYDAAREHKERLQAVLHRLWTAQENERRGLAADLHDGPAQSLAHIVIRLQTARRQIAVPPDGTAGCEDIAAGLEAAEAAARETLGQVRAIMSGLRPMSLDDLGLVSALHSEAAAVSARGRLTVEVRVTGAVRRLGLSEETGLFRIAREALANAERHSGSERARVTLDFRPAELLVRLEDWGCGFNGETALAARRAGRIGLVALRERADALGVALDLSSEVGCGTRVTVRCPIRAHGPADPAEEGADRG